jgi:high-affinity nickel-transport protein
MSPADVPAGWSGLVLLVLGLGARHGFDADHLAAVDAFTRLASSHRPRLARFCGSLFSLGHGTVVLVIALTVGTVSHQWPAPDWLEPLGSTISIGTLVLLGLANLAAVIRTPGHQMVRLVGLRARFLRPGAGHSGTVNAPVVLATGALFALSFDTISQAALFAFLGARLGGSAQALALGLIFVAGMLMTDGLQGLWVARLLRRADRRALATSRIMALTVSALSLAVALLSAARLASPAFDTWTDERGLALGVGLTVLFSAIAALALYRSRQGTRSEA